MLSEFLRISPRISVLPIIHGSGDFAVEVRRVMLSTNFDCLAVPLPPSFQATSSGPSISSRPSRRSCRRSRSISIASGRLQDKPKRLNTAGVQLRPDRSLPGSDCRAAHRAWASRFRGPSSIWRRPNSSRMGADAARSLRAQARAAPSGSPRPCCRPIPRPGRRQQAARCRTMAADCASWKSGTARSCLSARSWIGRGFARPTTRPWTPTRTTTSKPTQILSVNPATLVFLSGRTAVRDGRVRTGAGQSRRRREPVDRRRQGPAAWRPATATVTISSRGPARSRRS